MKKLSVYLIASVLLLSASVVMPSCKKGDDDPVISFKSRKDRFTNTWTLTKYEVNNVNQDLNGTSYIYNVRGNNTLTQTVMGEIFGFPTSTSQEGTWDFQNDEEDVKITIGGSSTTYNVQRLASDELWIKEIRGSDTHIYYFDGQN